MPHKILVIKNSPHEGLGIFESILKGKSITTSYVNISMGQHIPTPRGYGAVVVLGGPQSANDETPAIQEERKRVRECLDLTIPYLGICLGMQTLVKAYGGNVVKNKVPEIGLKDRDGNCFTVQITDAGKKDPLFYGIDSPIKIFQLHEERAEFEEIYGIELLGAGTHCRNQIIKIGKRAYGIQGHLELTLEMLAFWLDADPNLKALDRQALKGDFGEIYTEYLNTGARVFGNFLKIAGY